MIKGLIVLGLTAGISFAGVIQCKDNKEVCMVIKKEPLYKRIYFINMSDKDVLINYGSVRRNNAIKSLKGRIFKRYSKNVVMEVERKRHPITNKITNPYVGYSSYSYKYLINN